MSLLFRIIYAAHANGTHHKLALDSLCDLAGADATAWRRVFLKHVEIYLEGSKAPDKEFKDFKNHVLHVRDNYWGGAPEKAENWFRLMVRALQQHNFEEAVWCAGVLSHYYTDPIHPFHTAQSEAESNIHRAVEWSIAKSYQDLRARGLRHGLPEISAGNGATWLKDMLIAGAELSNQDYEALIAGYDFDIGVVDPPAGLNDTCRDRVGRLLVYASCGFAHILDRAFDEAGIAPPDVDLGVETVLATLKIPIKWVTRKMSDAAEARAVESMYDELQATGRVDQTLSEDDRTVRELHAREVLSQDQRRRQHQRQQRRSMSPLPQGTFPAVKPQAPPMKAPPMKARPMLSEPHRVAAEAPSPTGVADLNAAVVAASSSTGQLGDEPGGRRRPALRLDLEDEVEAAPSIGRKTAARLAAVGISRVADLMAADPHDLADQLATRHITAAVVAAWQDQSRLMLEIPGLRVSHSQLFVGAGFRSVEEIAFADPAELSAAILKFAATRDGQRVLGSGSPPDLEAVTGWIAAAGEALAA